MQSSPETLYALGGARLAAGDFAAAVSAYRAAAEQCAPDAALLNNLSIALLGIGRADDALSVLEQALSLQPDYVRALVNLGKTLGVLGRPNEAHEPLQRALTLSPDYVPALVNLGDMQGAAGHYPAAVQTLQRAIAVAPQSAEAHRSLGLALTRVGQTYDAVTTLERAISLQPASADSRTALAHVLLLEGRWHEAWPHHEYRIYRPRHALPVSLPADARWRHDELGDGTLWLIGEQGLGDQIQFARYARVLQEQGVHCVLSCDPKLVSLLRQAGLADNTVPHGAPFDAANSRWLPLLSAPGWHGTVPGNVPLRDGYLRAAPDRVAAWQSRLGSPERLRVAFGWQGNPAMETGWFAGRSPPLRTLAPLWAVRDVQFLSLQKGPAADDLRALGWHDRLLDPGAFDEGADAFLDSAAILRCVDLLVTSDSALAHLAGALGVECWLCLPAHPDWRWLRDTEQSPWYRSLRLFRQTRPGDWDPLFHRVADELRVRTEATVRS